MKANQMFVAIAMATFMWSGQARAQVVDINCSGTVDQTWDPGLKVLPQTVDYTSEAEYTSCTSSDPEIVAGGFAVSATYTNSCLANVGPTGAFTVHWSDGSKSTLELTGVGVNVLGTAQVFTAVGSVVSGRFQGDQAVMVSTYLVTQLAACLTPQGLTQLSGSTSLILTNL